MKEMILEKYSILWIEQFTAIKNILSVALQGIAHTIEHVGSTSVPNLHAKPIIDIDIIYNTTEDFTAIKICLQKIGYYHNGNQGIPERDVFKRNGATIVEPLDAIQHHLYVCLSNSLALERHILLRNFLRKNEWARIKYQQLKYEIAAMANEDKKQYAILKELHVNNFIDAAIAEEKQNSC